ncbi:MAG: hypothetical protein AAGC74_04175 [Verrucomicrobiota bacterium]
MPHPQRKKLPHHPTHPIYDPNSGPDIYFITICTTPRHQNQLANPTAWSALLETVLHRQQKADLACNLLLAMPDHLHGLFSFEGGTPMKTVITNLKSYLAKTQGIQWQRDFFDHRLRNWESATEKATYIRQNPVRAKLIENAADWPYLHDRLSR